MSKRRLWIFLFLIVFINGFEMGGYQASLYEIGRTYDLSITNMGFFAAAELLATMLAPIILGNWADRTDKVKSILLLLCTQIVFSLSILIGRNEILFIAGIFFLGLTTSALQFISIAAIAEKYPVSGKKKIGFITSMYAFGALTAPLAVSFYLDRNADWRLLFLLIAIGSVVAAAGVFLFRNEEREQTAETDEDKVKNGLFVISGGLLLCAVMFIYVGFENGFAFFIDTMFKDVFDSSLGKYALSIFWAVMIPSRILVGMLSRHSTKILLMSVIAIPVVTIGLSFSASGMIVMILCVPLSLFCGAIYPSVLITLVDFAKGNRTATATAMITAATGLGGVTFTALTGVLAGSFGIRNAICSLAVFFAVSIVCVIFAIRLHRRYTR